MSTDSCHSTQVPGSGTNRANRLLESLLPDYVAVDGQKIEGLKEYAKGLAAQLKFRAAGDIWDGDWKSFFEKETDSTQHTDRSSKREFVWKPEDLSSPFFCKLPVSEA